MQITEAGDALIITGATDEQRRRVKAAMNNPTPALVETLNRAQTAKIFGVHPGSLKRWEKSGKLRPIKITARTLRYDKREVLALLGGVSR